LPRRSIGASPNKTTDAGYDIPHDIREDYLSAHEGDRVVESMTVSARAAGTFSLGGDVSVNRLGYGAMRITGPRIIGEPRDVGEARRVLLRAVELGVTFIDTAHAYGPLVSERLIGETLAPYRDDTVIATKGGLHRNGRGAWLADCSPATLRAELEQSLQLLRVETIDLYQLHTVDPKVPVARSVGALAEMQREGMIKMIGVSNVDVDDLGAAQAEAQIVSVQNRFSVGDHDPVLDVCEQEGLAYIPWYPLRAGAVDGERRLREVARRLGATTFQVALAWLLRRSENMLPIPGTSAVPHLDDNVAAAALTLSDDDFTALGGP
jgi:pyridoxine 4-dehydrogenase